MKKRILIFFTLLFLLGVGAGPLHSQAVENASTPTNGYAISILKYKLSEAAALSTELPLDGTKAEKVTDKNGNALEPLAGISYEITRVSPVQGESAFAPVEGTDAFSVTVTTDQNGLARVDGLASGTYQVVEKENSLLNSVMEPVILELPLPQREGEALSEVYLYPKSSVVGPSEETENEEPNNAGTQTASDKLPQTSGSIGNAQPLYLILAFIVVMGAIGVKVLKTKHHKF